jgi:hypothetical protein
MRHPLQALGLLALVTTGCDRLQDDPIFVYGVAQQRDGSPLAGATLSYDRALVQERPNGSGTVYPKPVFTPHGTTTTEANGDYFMEVRYGDLQIPDPAYPGFDYTIPYRFRISRLDEDGHGTFVSFVFYDDVEVPTLRPWDARLSVAPGPEGHSVSFASAPHAAQLPPSAQLGNTVTLEHEVVPSPPSEPQPVLLLTSGGKPLFRDWAVSSPWTLSPYVLEDFAEPGMQLRALSVGEWWFQPLGAAHSYMPFRQEWRTPVVPLPVGTLRPVSRGVPCAPAPEGPCPWTDGLLDTVLVKAPPGQSAPQWLTLTLPEPTRLRHAVVRGMAGSVGSAFRMEGSLDGEEWKLMAVSLLRVSGSNVALALRSFAEQTQWDSPFDGGLFVGDGSHFGESPLEDVGPVRYVRITGTSYANNNNGVGRSISDLAEVSLFE